MKIEQPRRQPVVIFEINISKKRKIMKNCQNCGHECHCGGKCKQEVTTEFGEKHKIECCGNCRHEEKAKVNSMDYDSFNGA